MVTNANCEKVTLYTVTIKMDDGTEQVYTNVFRIGKNDSGITVHRLAYGVQSLVALRGASYTMVPQDTYLLP